MLLLPHAAKAAQLASFFYARGKGFFFFGLAPFSDP